MYQYLEYLKNISSTEDLMKYQTAFEDEIFKKQKELKEFIKQANERLKTLKDYEERKRYHVSGFTYKSGRTKHIYLLVEYIDGTNRAERYSFDKIADLRVKLTELKQKYSGVDWSEFKEEI